MRRALLVLGLCGCSLDLGGGEDEDLGPPVVSKVEHKIMPMRGVDRIDVLLVVDTAPTMAGELDVLTANAPSIANFFEQREGGLPDLHIAVVSSDLGTLGVDVGDPRCAGDGGGGRLDAFGCLGGNAYIADEVDDWGARTRNDGGDLAGALTCMVGHLRPTGCPWRQPLEAMRRALVDGAQRGFLRDEAYLFVAFIGDADDCSTETPDVFAPGTPGDPRDPFRCFARGVICDGADDPSQVGPRTGCRPRDGAGLGSIESYRDGLFMRKANPHNVVVAAVTPFGDVAVAPGPRLANSCAFEATAGTPGVRMQAFMDLFTDRNTYTTSCDSDWTDILSQLTGPSEPVILYPCIEAMPVDRDPLALGLQPDIAAWIEDIYQGTSFVVPTCEVDATGRCYRLVHDPLNCAGTPSELGLAVEPPLFPNAAYFRADIAVE